jgi:arabinan endo-1,5-alpha-L-arabinosidase
MTFFVSLPARALVFCLGVMMILGRSVAADPAGPGTYTNPVFDHDFPDPNLEFGHDGLIYAYSTNTGWTDLGPTHEQLIPILRSPDLVHWNFVGTVFSTRPKWKSQGGLWAPDVTFYKGKYYCYYAMSTWGDGDPGIGLAMAEKAAGPWTDEGKVFLSSEIGVGNSIDPMLVIEGGRMFLFVGSFRGIYGVPLSPDGRKPAGKPFQIADGAFEGSFIYRHGDYYYYLGSSGSCCEGAASTYHVLVGRSQELAGPYVDREGRPLLHGGGTMFLHGDSQGLFVGTGHNGDLVTDDAGTTWIVYHAFHKNDPGRGRVLMLDRVNWVDGWPEIAHDEDSTTPQPAPVFHGK